MHDRFRFGDGVVVDGYVAWIYPAGVYGKNGRIQIAEVDRNCPPLMSNQAMQDLKIRLAFGDKATDVKSAEAYGKPMERSRSGHPVQSIMQFDREKGFPINTQIKDITRYNLKRYFMNGKVILYDTMNSPKLLSLFKVSKE